IAVATMTAIARRDRTLGSQASRHRILKRTTGVAVLNGGGARWSPRVWLLAEILADWTVSQPRHRAQSVDRRAAFRVRGPSYGEGTPSGESCSRNPGEKLIPETIR